MSIAVPIARHTRTATLNAGVGQVVFSLPTTTPVWAVEDVQVFLRVGTSKLWNRITSGFTVALVSRQAQVTFAVPPRAALADPVVAVRLKSARTDERLTDVTRAGAIRSDRVETALDMQATLNQELRRDVDDLAARALTVAEGDDPALFDLAGMPNGSLLYRDANGNFIGVPVPPGNVVTSAQIVDATAAGRALLTSATAQAQRALLGITMITMMTLSAAQALASVDGIDIIETFGRAAPFDNGGARWMKVEAQPGHPGKWQHATGAWFELQGVEVTPEMFGAQGGYDRTAKTGPDDTTAINNAFAYIEARGGGVLWGRPARKYRCDDEIYPCSNSMFSTRGPRCSINRHLIPTTGNLYRGMIAVRDPAGTGTRSNVVVTNVDVWHAAQVTAQFTATAGQATFTFNSGGLVLSAFDLVIYKNNVEVSPNGTDYTYTSSSFTLATPCVAGDNIKVGITRANARCAAVYAEAPAGSYCTGITFSNMELTGNLSLYIGSMLLHCKESRVQGVVSRTVKNRGHYAYGNSIDNTWQDCRVDGYGSTETGAFTATRCMDYACDNNPYSGTFQENTWWIECAVRNVGRGFSWAGLCLNCGAQGVRGRYITSYGALLQGSGGMSGDRVQLQGFSFLDVGQQGVYALTSFYNISDGEIAGCGSGVDLRGSGAEGEAWGTVSNVKVRDLATSTGVGLYVAYHWRSQITGIQVTSALGNGVDVDNCNACAFVGVDVAVGGTALTFRGGSSRNKADVMLTSSNVGLSIISGCWMNEVTGRSWANTTNISDNGSTSYVSTLRTG